MQISGFNCSLMNGCLCQKALTVDAANNKFLQRLHRHEPMLRISRASRSISTSRYLFVRARNCTARLDLITNEICDKHQQQREQEQLQQQQRQQMPLFWSFKRLPFVLHRFEAFY